VAEVVTIETQELGDRSYLVHDGVLAVVVDPQRDIDRVLQAAEAAHVRVSCVAETHLHNDYVSGGRELAAATGATHLVAGGDEVAFPCTPVVGGEHHEVGRLVLRALATPGHTPHHIAYAVGEGGGPTAVFTGGSLLFGTVGRTDLVGPHETLGLTRDQYRSAHHLADELDDTVFVYPTHGFGSFCSSTETSGATTSTIGEERRHNLAFQAEGEEAFVASLLAGLTAYPRYYAHMGAINRAGPAPVDLTPPRSFDGPELHRRIRAGEWVVDLRSRRAFAAAHVPCTISVEGGSSFSTFLGWAIPWGTPVSLLADRAEDLVKAQRDLARIGIDRPAGVALGDPAALSTAGVASYPRSDFPALRAALDAGEEPAVLDVRRDDEWDQGRVEGALHIHFCDVEARMDEVPDRRPVWVYCATGFRAAVAASLLARAGRRPVLIDDDFAQAAKAGLAIAR
jgi:hydroxyacylglutathione hydrolase